jgi:hypothetical protein
MEDQYVGYADIHVRQKKKNFLAARSTSEHDDMNILFIMLWSLQLAPSASLDLEADKKKHEHNCIWGNITKINPSLTTLCFI